MENEKNSINKIAERLPTIVEAIIAMVLVIATIIIGIRMKIGAPMSLFFGAVVSTTIAFYLRNKWEDIEKAMINMITDGTPAIIIIIIVGMIIGVWIIGGTVPALMYYGLKSCSPKIILPLTFILCSITSVFTGTSFGSVATMGLALVGVGAGMGMPLHIIAGAAVAGSYFGDKMSPLSDTTNMAPVLSGTTLYKHIGSEMFTTVPPTLICIVIYYYIGLSYAEGAMDTTKANIMTGILEKTFSISPWALIPAILVLFLSAIQVPAVLGLSISLVVSIIFAIFLQSEPFARVAAAGFAGYIDKIDANLVSDLLSNAGIATGDTVVRQYTNLVDGLLSKGGIVSIQETVTLIICACMMGGALHKSGVLTVFVEKGLFKMIKNPAQLVVGTMVYCYAVLLLSGNQILGIILGGRTFKDAYAEMNVHAKVLSRTLEDTNTIGAPLVPWSTAALFITSVLGVSVAYIPYALLGFIVPMFSLLCAYTKIGMWDGNEAPMWGKNKGISPNKEQKT